MVCQCWTSQRAVWMRMRRSCSASYFHAFPIAEPSYSRMILFFVRSGTKSSGVNMIFLGLIFLGSHYARTVQEILPFFLCILLRSAYLQRSLKLFHTVPTVAAFIFFIVNWLDRFRMQDALNTSSWES